MTPVTRSAVPRRAALLWLAIVVGCNGCAALARRAETQAHADESRQLWRRGVTALETGQVAEAATLLHDAAEIDPEDGDTRSQLSEALWKSGRHAEALEHAEAACLCERTDARLAVRAGEMRLAQGDPQRASEWGNVAVSLDGRSPAAWALRGRSFALLGQPERAVADFQQALRYAPADVALLEDLAKIYRDKGDHRRALATLHHLLDCYPPGEQPPGVLAMAGESCLAIGRPQAASEHLRLATERGALGPDIHYRLAEAEAACGRPVQALADARRALEADGGHTQSRDLVTRLTVLDAGGALR
ncbi:MAG: tetratricopeptide repeat protein [Lacipirellulaceae bacterium]